MIRQTGLVVLAMFFLAGMSAPAFAQLEDNLSSYTDETAEGYLKPLQEAFGQGLNSNFFTSAAIAQQGIHVRFEVKAMNVSFKDEDKTFTATSGGDFDPVTTVEASTVVGPEESVSITGVGGTQFDFPGGFNLGSLTIGVPQLTVSGFRGTELMVRWIAVDSGDAEIGDISLFGVGARHNVSQYLVNFPVDVAGAVYYQEFDLGNDLISSSALSIGAQASKSFGLLTPYGGISFDSFSMTAEYTSKAGAVDEDVKLEMESENSLHLTVGVGFSLGPLYVNVGGDLAQRSGISGGFGFGF